MSEGDLAVIDTNEWKPVQSPGLKAPRHQLSYDSPEVQQVLMESFHTMFPNIVEDEKGSKRYQIINSSSVDIFPRAKPAKNITDIPRAEMLRLMEGWIRLRRKLQEQEIDPKVGAILLNFRVPNPRESLDRYMLYKEGDEMRLVIRWGFETKERRAVSLERAISILMDVPLGHMRSILSTSMTPATSTVPVSQMIASAAAGEGGQNRGNGIHSNKTILALAGAGVCMLLVGIALVIMNAGKNEPEVKFVPVQSFDDASEEKTAPQLVEVIKEVVVEAPTPEPVIKEIEVVKEVVVIKEVPAASEKVQPSLDTALIGAPVAMNTQEIDLMLDDTVPPSSESNKQAGSNFSLDAMIEEQQSSTDDLIDSMMR